MGRKILWIAVPLVVVAGVGLGLVLTGKPPNPEEQDGEEAASYVASNSFKKLPSEDKEAYLKETWENREGKDWRETWENLDEEQKERLKENVGEFFRERMRQRVDEYFELPEEEREAVLDEIIDKMQGHRKQWEARRGSDQKPGRDGGPGDGGRGPGRGGRDFTPDRMKSMLENTSPEDRAKFIEFHNDLRERMKERGMEPRR